MGAPMHRLECACGRLGGEVDGSATFNRGSCYCKDCQAFAYFLGDAERVLDAHGGTDVVQTSPQAVRFTRGREHLACMRLTSAGLMRWYAACCNTPIGNTPSDYRLSFVGLIHCCLGAPQLSLDASFGVSRMRVHTGSAWGEPKPHSRGVALAVVRLGAMMLRARLSGAYRDTPFFERDGAPVVVPKTLSAEAHAALMSSVSRH